MHTFWTAIIQPALELLRPLRVVEIGCGSGRTTRRLLNFCRNSSAFLHGVDPSPRFDVEAWEAEFDDCFRMHRTTSLQALPDVPAPDAVLIDGDHNWYTVLRELEHFEASAWSADAPFPLTFLHHVDWPYARRDSYYDPQTIPTEYRHPFRQGGLRSDSATLVSDGLNAKRNHAMTENTPCNGVRTAIEDFLEQTALSLELITIPGFHGLGVLVSAERKEQYSPLAEFLDCWRLEDGVRQYTADLEAARVLLAGQAAQTTATQQSDRS